jgi:hypothetical protein
MAVFPLPLPFCIGMVGMIAPFAVMYWASRTLGDVVQREADSLLVLAVCQFAVYLVTVIWLESLLRQQFSCMRQREHSERRLAEHYRRCSTDLLEAARELTSDDSFATNIRSLLFADGLQLSDVLLQDITSFHVGQTLLRLVEADLALGAEGCQGKSISSAAATAASYSTTSTPRIAPTPRPGNAGPAAPAAVAIAPHDDSASGEGGQTALRAPVLKDAVRLESLVKKLASAFDCIGRTPIEVYVFVDPALCVIRTDRALLRNVLYLALTFAEQNIQRLLRSSPSSKDEVHEVIIRVFPAPTTAAVKAFAQKRMLTVEVIDSGFRIHTRTPGPTATGTERGGAARAETGRSGSGKLLCVSDGNLCFAEHMCRKMLAQCGLKYKLSDVAHYKYVNKQELSVYYLPHPR